MGSVFGPVRFLLPVCRFCWFLYTFNIHLYMHIFRRIFLSNYWWQESDIWSQVSYRYAILWETFVDPSDSYFLFTEERGYHKWTLALTVHLIWFYLNIIIGREIVTWSSLKTRSDLKNHVLPCKNMYWLRENIRLFPPLTGLVECCPNYILQNFNKFP